MRRLGLILFGIATIVESVVNLFFYLTFLDKLMVLDISLPFWTWYTNKFLKKGFLRRMKKENPDGQNI